MKRLEIETADGYRIGARLYQSAGRSAGTIIVAGATGVPQGYYRKFATYGRNSGFHVLTFDYRGIGESRPGTLKHFKADFLDWAVLDLAGAVEYMAGAGEPIYLVGHSFGGHALGLLPDPGCIAASYFFAAGAGWHGWMPLTESIRVRLMWKIVLPAVTFGRGYAPISLLRAGEDLPLGVYQQWRRWCRFRHYFFDDPEVPHISEQFARVRSPIVAANAMDDLWAMPRSRNAFMKGYRNALITYADIDPDAIGTPIGHMGYFRSGCRGLWDQVLDFFLQKGISD